MEEDILPHRECQEGDRLEEERRLMYVGITRAQKSLTLTCCGKRKKGGDWVHCEPSRFLDEIDGAELRHGGQEDDSDSARADGRNRLANLKAMLAAGK